MTKQQIDELRELEKAATPGPWVLDCGKMARSIVGGVIYLQSSMFGRDVYRDADMKLAAAARNALPELLDELMKLKKY